MTSPLLPDTLAAYAAASDDPSTDPVATTALSAWFAERLGAAGCIAAIAAALPLPGQRLRARVHLNLGTRLPEDAVAGVLERALAAVRWASVAVRVASIVSIVGTEPFGDLADHDGLVVPVRSERAPRGAFIAVRAADGATTETDEVIIRAAGRFLGAMEVANLKGNVAAPGLTSRERRVLGLAAAGLTNDEIAARLGISGSGVVSRILSAQGKLGAANRTQAAALAVWYGEIDPEGVPTTNRASA